MIRIGIELNNVVRNINYQVMKYYKKDINPEFDETTISANKTSIIEDLNFDSKARNEFMFVDYPYELFGCARVVERNLSVTINDWLISLADEDVDYDVSFFSQHENDLSIPSSYYFLSKIATRVRTTHFPTNDENIWDLYDVIVTTDPKLVESKPEGKRVILIEKEDNKEAIKNADYSFESLSKAIESNSLTNIKDKENIEENKNEDTSIIGKIKGFFKF